MFEVNETGSILGDDKVYTTRFIAKAHEVPTIYISNVSRMIRYLYQNFTNGGGNWYETFVSPMIKMRVPYNWEYEQKKPGANSLPFGYGNYSHDGNGIQLWIPNETIDYPLYKEYRMDITYDPFYPFERNTTNNIGSNVGQGVIAYALALRHDWNHPNWNETLEEISPDYGVINIINKAVPLISSPQETNGFVPINLELNRLNLPSQFYVTFSVKDAFLHNGLLCTLMDRTPFVAVPPPVYTIDLTDNYLKGLRPGDERDIQLKMFSDTSLPYQVSFSSSGEKGIAELSFKPPNLFGTSKGFINSDLHIKILPTAEPSLYPVRISANISTKTCITTS